MDRLGKVQFATFGRTLRPSVIRHIIIRSDSKLGRKPALKMPKSKTFAACPMSLRSDACCTSRYPALPITGGGFRKCDCIRYPGYRVPRVPVCPYLGTRTRIITKGYPASSNTRYCVISKILLDGRNDFLGFVATREIEPSTPKPVHLKRKIPKKCYGPKHARVQRMSTWNEVGRPICMKKF
eukprot:1245537-Rhodomonas_salina.2